MTDKPQIIFPDEKMIAWAAKQASISEFATKQVIACALTDYRTRTGIDVADVVAKLSAGTHVVVPVEPTRSMIDAGETTLENAQDSSYSSDVDGNRYDYTYFKEGMSGAAKSIYLTMIYAAQEKVE